MAENNKVITRVESGLTGDIYYISGEVADLQREIAQLKSEVSALKQLVGAMSYNSDSSLLTINSDVTITGELTAKYARQSGN